MADNNKAVGPLAAAKLVSLIKAETGKKYDKTGGKIEGSAEITGGLKVGMSSEFSSSIKAGSEISSDMLLMAPIVSLHDPATEESISFGVSGENAAKVTSPVSGGGTQYARLAVGTPTGDNDAATKAYVDAKADTTVYVDFWGTGQNEVYSNEFKAWTVSLGTDKTFDYIFDLINSGADVVARLYQDSTKSELVAESIQSELSGDKTLGNINFLFVHATTEVVFGFPTIADSIFVTKVDNATSIYAIYKWCALPIPAGDSTDSGKVPTINGKKWELKALPVGSVTVDAAMSSTSTNPVQNKVIKKYVDDKVAEAGSNITVDTSLSSTSTNPVQNKAVKAAIDAKADKTALDGKLDKAGGTLTGNLTGKYITGTWLQSTEAENLGKTPGKIAVLDDSGWVYYRTPDELLADIGAATVSAMLDKAYPVGSIYMSVNSTNPKTLFGGTWVQIKDRFLLAAGTTYKAGATGGEATHTLTTSEMPSHNHAVYTPNDGAADHSAPGNYPDGTSDSTYYAVGSYTSSAGGGGAHNNMPPYLSVYVWKRTA